MLMRTPATRRESKWLQPSPAYLDCFRCVVHVDVGQMSTSCNSLIFITFVLSSATCADYSRFTSTRFFGDLFV